MIVNIVNLVLTVQVLILKGNNSNLNNNFIIGDCAVCSGYLNPSPKEILVDGSEWIRNGPRFNDGEDHNSDEEYHSDEYNNYEYDEYGNVVEEVEEEDGFSENVLNLWEYCRHGLVDNLRSLVDFELSDEELNMLDRNGRSALYLCCDGGHEDCVRILLQQSGINCNVYDDHPNNVGPPLLAATLNGFENIVALLLEHPEIEVNSAGRNFDRACDRAIFSGNERIVSMLLNHPDTDPWRTDMYYNTCLHAACNVGSLSIVRQLLQHRTCTLEKVKIRCDRGSQPRDALEVAYEREHDDIVLTLLEFPGIDTSGFLVNICERSRRPTIPATILALLDVNRPVNSSNLPPLIHACTYNKAEAVKKLLSFENINFNCVNSNEETLLMLATERGLVSIVQLLLNHPVTDPNHVSKSGETSLIIATRSGLVSIVQLLLNHPVTDPNYVSKSGVFALLLCPSSCHSSRSITELLLNHPRIESSVDLAMKTACQKGFTDVVRLLVEYLTTNINGVDEDGVSYLHYACFHGHKEIAELLLKHDAIEVFIKTNNGNTPLNFAVKKGRNEIVDMLIHHSQFDPSTMFIPSR